MSVLFCITNQFLFLTQELTGEYSVSSMPTFIFFKNGQKIESFSGASENKLREMIDKYI